MNTFKCIGCQKTQAHTCTCGSGHLWIVGDEHLVHHGIDAYLSLEYKNGDAYLLIKKPSGQATIPIEIQDLIARIAA
jgi:hypothetical protein